MTKPQDYTVKQFISEIRTIIEANPDKVNAFAEAANGVPGSCVYENQQGDHCIIGEWLSSIDLLDSLPWSGFEDGNGMKECISLDPDVDEQYPYGLRAVSAYGVLLLAGFNREICDIASKVQNIADKQVPWKTLLDTPELSGN